MRTYKLYFTQKKSFLNLNDICVHQIQTNFVFYLTFVKIKAHKVEPIHIASEVHACKVQAPVYHTFDVLLS